MALALVNTKDMDRATWLEFRRKGIGGSDAAAIAGLNKWKSPVAVWLEKTGQIEPEEAGEAALWGQKLEDVVARHFAEVTGLKVQRRNAILQHPDHLFMLANLDRVIVDKENGWGVLEIKTTSAYRKDAWEDDRVPDEYMLQVQHYLAVCGYQYAYIAVLIGGQTYKHQYIPRDEEIISYLIQIESDFWKLVESGTPPEMDGSEASSEVLGLLYPESNGCKVQLPLNAEALIEEFEEAQSQETIWAEKKNLATNKLKELLGENEIGIIGDRKVAWKTVISNRIDSKALKSAHPDIYEEFIKPSSSRRFQIR